jgi:hypothetical protein
MTHLTALSAEELDAQIEALTAEKARRDAEPDWDAWRPALLHFIAATHYPPVSPGLDTCDKMHIRALQAAAPHFPTPEIDESQIHQIAHRCQFADGIDSRALTPYNAAQRAIRETMRLLGHAPKRERLTDHELDLLAVEVSYNTLGKHAAALKMARLLREKGHLA